MSCTVPSTNSPGKLHLIYTNTTSSPEHGLSWWTKIGTPIGNAAVMGAEALRLATYLVDCTNNNTRFTGWKATAPDGSFIVGGNLGSLGPGTHGVVAGMKGWLSLTVAFVGHASPAVPGNCAGESIARLHNYGTLNIAVGQKEVVASTDSAFEDFINLGLNASDIVAADRYGQDVVIEANMPIQWNAYTQRKEGS